MALPETAALLANQSSTVRPLLACYRSKAPLLGYEWQIIVLKEHFLIKSKAVRLTPLRLKLVNLFIYAILFMQ